MQKDLSAYRKSYEKGVLTKESVGDKPVKFFTQWFEEAEASPNIEEANAMTLSTMAPSGYPASRVVLLKGFSEAGFVFYTNYNSDKGKAIAKDPKVCLSFFWPSLERQVIIHGLATKISAQESSDYFASRPKGSQVAALASNQSQVVPSRTFLENRMQEVLNSCANQAITRPEYWGGYIVQPKRIEFWQGRANRLHDRIRFLLQDAVWQVDRLAP